MRVEFKHIVLCNFMSYKDSDLYFDKEGYVFVKGINNNTIDNASSNGSGKSSLFSAISWCLTGMTVTESKSVENLYVNGSTKVTLEFDIDNDNFKITRVKNPSKLYILKNGEDISGKGIRDTENILKEELPMLTHSLLNSVIILGQGLPQRFSNNTPAGRKEVLEKLAGTDFMIEDLKQKVTNRNVYINSRLTELSTHKSMCNDLLQSLNNSLSETKNTLKSLQDNNVDNIELKKVNIGNSIQSLEAHIQLLKIDLDTKTKSLGEFQDKYDTFSNSKNILISNIEQFEDIPILQESINDLTNICNKLQNDFNLLQSFDNIDFCSSCWNKIKDYNNIKYNSDVLKDKYNETKNLLTCIKNEMNLKSDINSDLQIQFNSAFENCQKDLFSEISTLHEEIQSLNLDLINSTGELNTLSNEYNELDKAIMTYTDKVKDTQEQIVNIENDIYKATKELENYNTLYTEYLKRFEINKKMNTIIKRDFRAYLLSNVVSFIDNKIKEYTLYTFGTEASTFKIDGNNIVIKYDGKDYETLSGGEKQKLDVIIQLAIRDMLCTYTNFSSNILVLDEITDSLDYLGCQQIFDLITNKLNDVDSIYIISHHNDFDLPYDNEIIIEKGNDKISQIIN